MATVCLIFNMWKLLIASSSSGWDNTILYFALISDIHLFIPHLIYFLDPSLPLCSLFCLSQPPLLNSLPTRTRAIHLSFKHQYCFSYFLFFTVPSEHRVSRDTCHRTCSPHGHAYLWLLAGCCIPWPDSECTVCEKVFCQLRTLALQGILPCHTLDTLEQLPTFLASWNRHFIWKKTII